MSTGQMKRFDVAASTLVFEPGVYGYLRQPVRQYIVPIPVHNENGNDVRQAIVSVAKHKVHETAERHNTSLRSGAYVPAIEKVARTLKVRGIYG